MDDGGLRERLIELEAVESPDPDQRAELASLLAEAAARAGERADISTEDERLERLAELTEQWADPAVRAAYARALAGATDVIDRDSEFEEACSEERFRESHDRLSSLHDEYPEDDAVTVQYARGLAQMVAIEGDQQRFDATAERLQELRRLYDGGADVAAQLARGLAQAGHKHAVARANDDGGQQGKGQQLLDEIDTLYERHSTDAVAAELAYALRNVSIVYGNDGNETARAETLVRLATCYEDHPTDSVADHYVWALAIAAGDTGRDGDLDKMHSRLDRAEKLFEAHPVADVADSLARGYAEVADVYFETERTHAKGESYLDELESLYERFPAAVASHYSLKLALAVRVYAEDDAPADAETKLDELDALLADQSADSGVDGTLGDSVDALFTDQSGDSDVRENLGEALYDLVEYYANEGDIERAREIADHPVTEDRAPDAFDDKDYGTFEVFALYAQIREYEERSFHRSQRSPVGHVPGVELPVLSLLLTSAVFGVYAAVDPALTLFQPILQTSPIGPLWGSIVAVIVGVGFVAVDGISRHVLPAGLFLPLGPVGFVLKPAQTTKQDGSTAITQTKAVIALVGLGVVGGFVLDPVVGQYLFYGVVCWTLLAASSVGLVVWLVTRDILSPSVTVGTTIQTLDKIGVGPMEAEQILSETWRNDDWDFGAS